MASSCFILPLTAAASACLPLSKPAAGGKHGRRRLSCECKATAGGGDDGDLLRRLDRRDVLLGLTGVGATATLNFGHALAADDSVPATCVTALITDQVIQCVSADGFQCPGPYLPEDVVDFSALPPPTGPLRVRRPAHLVAADQEYVRKYEAGVRMMKDLDATGDPRSFKSQAAIHEAYCNFHYKVTTAAAASTAGVGSPPQMDFDVHFSSIFAPWHRMYIYFFERIIGELINDSSFALPYWNWDAPDGMMLPAIFNNASSPLYDAKRNQEHVNAVMDLNVGPGMQNDLPLCTDDACVKETNLCTVYRQMAVDTAAQFHGNKFCAARVMSPGSLENAAHTAVHIWVGDPLSANRGEDMGVLGTAARDPVFYSHHANVDRLWHLWTAALGNEDFVEAGVGDDWRDTGFVFYDEKRRPVRIRVRDVLDAGRLGYTYEEKATLEWQDKRPKPATGIDRSAAAQPGAPAAISFPVALKKGQNEYVTVDRPEEARASGGSSKKAPEVLVVDVTIDPCEYARFNVLVNVPRGQEARVGPQDSEFAGSFENLPHGGGDGGGRGMGALKLAYRFALRELVEDLGCGQDRQLDVTLIPLAGQMVVVDDVRVELLK